MHGNLLITLAFVTLLAVNANTKIEEDDNVLVLTTENFEEALLKYPKMMIKFYAPWCGHCKKMAPDYKSAAQLLLAEQSDIRLAKVDGTVERSLVSRFGIEGYPTLKLFQPNQIVDYDGPRVAASLIAWIKQQTASKVLIVNKLDDFEKVLGDHEVTAVFFGDKMDDDKSFSLFESVADDYREDIAIAFVASNSNDVKELAQYDGEQVGVAVYKNADSSFIRYSEETIRKAALQAFIKKHRYPSILKFDSSTSRSAFNSRTANMFLVKGDSQKDHDALTEMTRVGEELSSRLTVFYAEYNSLLGRQLATFLEVFEHQLPAVIIYYYVSNN